MTSVVVPAHNEEAVIARCLAALAGQVGQEGEIVVVCNGCTDRTAEVARAVDARIRVEEIAVPSKIRALNHGDAVASRFPRLYVDADVVVADGVVPALVAALDGQDVELAAPGVRYDLSACSRPVRWYYRIWLELPSVRDDVVGRGVYALSAAGRTRFGEFPDVLGDDHFVRDLVPSGRRRVVHEVHSTVRAPRTLAAVVRRKRRSFRGNAELDARTAEGRRRARGRRLQWALVVRRQPRLLPLLPVYLGVTVLARAAALAERLGGSAARWHRDETSRQ